MNATLSDLFSIAVAVTVVGCGASDSSAAPFAGYRIVAADGSMPSAMVGDALRLSVVEMRTDGSSEAVSSDARILWSGAPVITALPVGSAPAQSLLPQPSEAPTAMWVSNPGHLGAAETAGVLFVLDAGSTSSPSLAITASVAGGAGPEGHAAISIPVAAFPTGDASRGQRSYSANCASCHGAHAEGGIAPGLNNEPITSPGIAGGRRSSSVSWPVRTWTTRASRSILRCQSGSRAKEPMGSFSPRRTSPTCTHS